MNRIEYLNLDLELHHATLPDERKVKELFGTYVLEYLDEYLEKMSASMLQTIKIPSITIEKEVSSLNNMTSVFKDVFMSLKKQIDSQIKLAPLSASAVSIGGAEGGFLEVIKIYLIKGILPLSFSSSEFQELVASEPIQKALALLKSLRFNAFDEKVYLRFLEIYSLQNVIDHFTTEEGEHVIKSMSSLLGASNEGLKTRSKASEDSNDLHFILSELKKKKLFSTHRELESQLLYFIIHGEFLPALATMVEDRVPPLAEASPPIENSVDDSTVVEEEEVFILEHAGLFLLHPFLKDFFVSQSVLESDNQWLDINKATQLLYFIATGDDQPKDYELSAEKILLGLHPSQPIAIERALSIEEKQACIGMMESAISHWTALKNSGTNFLQQMFLQRVGTTKQNKENWSIAIHKQAQDILLEQLPWGLGMIKLPWMEGMIDITIK